MTIRKNANNYAILKIHEIRFRGTKTKHTAQNAEFNL